MADLLHYTVDTSRRYAHAFCWLLDFAGVLEM